MRSDVRIIIRRYTAVGGRWYYSRSKTTYVIKNKSSETLTLLSSTKVDFYRNLLYSLDAVMSSPPHRCSWRLLLIFIFFQPSGEVHSHRGGRYGDRRRFGRGRRQVRLSAGRRPVVHVQLDGGRTPVLAPCSVAGLPSGVLGLVSRVPKIQERHEILGEKTSCKCTRTYCLCIQVDNNITGPRRPCRLTTVVGMFSVLSGGGGRNPNPGIFHCKM